MRRLATLGASSFLVFFGAFLPLPAFADVVQSVSDTETTDQALWDGGWSEELGTNLSGTITEVSFPVDWVLPDTNPASGRMGVQLRTCSDATYSSCNSIETASINFSAVSGTTTVVINNATAEFQLTFAPFDPAKYYKMDFYRIAGPSFNTNVKFKALGSATDSYAFGSTTAGGLADLAFTIKGVSHSEPPPPPPATGPSNILFLPGIEGSRLYQKVLGIEDKRWEPGFHPLQGDTKALYLNADGTSKNPTYTKAGDAIARVAIPTSDVDVYRTFFEQLRTMRDTNVIKDYLVFPYDWRMSPEDIVNSGTPYEDGTHFVDQELISLASTSPTGKVTIVAHSNGGLVAKALITKLVGEGKGDMVDKVIFIDVPQIGTPMTVVSMLHGDSQKLPGFMLTQPVARGLSENMPDAYTLLPSPAYFGQVSDPVVDVTNAPLLRASAGITGNTISTEDAFMKFMTGVGGRAKPAATDIETPDVLSSSLFTNAAGLHSRLDTWTPPAGVQVIQVAGWGKDTPKGVAYTESQSYVCPKGATSCSLVTTIHHDVLMTQDGDDTVVAPSETAAGIENTYFVNLFTSNKAADRNRGHGDITESIPFQSLFPLLLASSSPPSLPQYVSTTLPNSSNNAQLQLRIHSPVSLDAYDIQGRHTGIVSTTSDAIFKDEQIPNSTYQEYGEEKHLSLPYDPSSVIRLHGLDTGTFTLDVTVISDTSQTSKTYRNIPVTASSSISVALSSDSSQSPSLLIDYDGNGTVDTTVTSTMQAEDPLVYLRLVKAIVTQMDMGATTKRQVIARLSNVEHILTKDAKWETDDDDNDSVDIKKIEKAEDRMLRKLNEVDGYIARILAKPAAKRPLQERMNETQAGTILTMNAHLKTLIK